MEPLKGGTLAGNMPQRAQKIIDNSEIQKTNVDLALSWIFETPGITCVLSGMTDLEMIKQNIEITNNYKSNPLTDTELKVIEDVREVLLDLIKIPCTECEYCLPCPKDVDIPGIFSLYNYMFLFPEDTTSGIHSSYIEYSKYSSEEIEENDASACIECGICMRKCPQQLEIPKLLKQVNKVFCEKNN